MSEKSYIQPGQLSAAEATQVLSALNSTASAEELAAAVEFPHELDVGVGIARRIINRRGELGGEFTTLQQLADVPLIGPERFTEIVSALTGQALPWADSPGHPSVPLLAELRVLRETVANLQKSIGARYRIELRPLSPGGFIGQEQLLRARVVEAGTGKPKANAHFTLACNWGNLHHQVGFAYTRGQVIRVTTDLQGEAKIRYTPPTHELLYEAQRYALESALGRLDRQAGTPPEAVEGFKYIVEQYNLELNKDLRGAIDIYIREQQMQLTESINRNAWVNDWRYRDVLLSAYVQNEASGTVPFETDFSTSVDSMATMVLRLKDWVVPWYQALLGKLTAANELNDAFDQIAKGTEDANLLMGRMLSSIHVFAANQRGIAGELASQEVSSRYITGFLAEGMSDLPIETQISLFPSLNIAARTIRKGGMGALEVVTQNRMDLKQEINIKAVEVGDLSDALGILSNRMGGYDVRIENVESDFSEQLKNAQLQIGRRIDGIEVGFRSDIKSFAAGYTAFKNDYARFTADYGQFNSNYDQFSTDYGDFKKDRIVLTQNIGKVVADIAGLSTNYTALTKDVSKVTTDLDSLSGDYTDFKKDVIRRG